MPRHRVLLLIYPAQGHINPAFQFAKRLLSFGAHVTLCTTLHMHRRISNKPTLPGLSFLPFSDGFDDGFKSTEYSLYASELRRRGSEFVTDLILSAAEAGQPFTSLVYTPLLHWAAEAARGLHLPTALLWIQPATVFDIIYYYFNGYRESCIDKNPSSRIELPGLPFALKPSDLPSFLLPSNSSFIVSYFEEQFRDLEIESNPTILVNSFEALEPEAMAAVDGIKLIPIGPLIPSAFLDGKDPNDTSFGVDIFRPSNGCAEWLDSNAEKSVVYVSFGSFVVLSKAQTEEIARGLLNSGYPFLWVMRENEKLEDGDELSCREELEEKGKMVTWCSQVEVLSHRSVGCFLTHCGWNSTIESLVSGVPMVAFPRFSDQTTNAKMVEDVWRIGVRMDQRVNEDGVVEGKEIRRCLDEVMGNGEKGEELRRNAEKWKGLAKEAGEEGGSSEKNLRDFLAVGGSVAEN